MNVKYLICVALLCVGVYGCDEDDKSPAPAPAAPAISMTVTSQERGIGVTVSIPQNMSVVDQNIASHVYTTALNSGLSVASQAHEEAINHADTVRVSWQTFWIGLMTLAGVIVVCATSIIKGVMAKK